jgi:LCP family protein required for cell wall assembly
MRFVHRLMSSPPNPKERHGRLAVSMFVLLVAAAAGVACTLSVPAVLAGPTSTPVVLPYLPATWTPTTTSPQQSTPTRTPTGTTTPAPTQTPTPANPWEGFAGPTQPSAIDIPRPMPLIEQPESVVNIVVIGTDSRANMGIARSDTLMIASLDKASGQVTLLSIPRDLYVYIPGWRVDRINTADVYGREDLVKTTILYNFGLRTDHFIRVGFSGFIETVNMLGGIDVHVTRSLSDSCGGRQYNYTPGVYHMDGFTALCYVRMRYSTSDFDRLRREQEVIEAIFAKTFSLYGLTKVPQLFANFGNLVQTDITVADALPLTPLAGSIAADPSRIHLYRVDQTMVTSYRVPSSGAAVLLPNREAISAMLQTAFGP